MGLIFSPTDREGERGHPRATYSEPMVSQDGVRLFVSLDPPAPARREAAEWGRLAARCNPGLRPIAPEAIHLTLAFLGTLPSDLTGAISQAIVRVGRAVPGIEGGAPIWLPKRRPRALAIEIREGKGILAEMRADLVTELTRETDWRPERRGFLPHLTVARAGRGFRTSGVLLDPTPSLSFGAESITLYRSHLNPSGARYEALFSLPLPPSESDRQHPLPGDS